ncbi:MAG: trypsin-like peptidase domain-containing protein [Lachnospiraceae bacterium]|nr:trypsin-like peptidase domain-containing protein [Lachnospiraceae bacterium]
MDDKNKELYTYETEESVTQPEVTDNPSAEVNPEIVEESTEYPVPESQTETIVDEPVSEIPTDSFNAERTGSESGRADDMPVNGTDNNPSDNFYKYDPNGVEDERPYAAPDTYTRNGEDVQGPTGSWMSYTQPGAGQSSSNQVNTGGQGTYGQMNAGNQSGYMQPGVGQGSYNQANTSSQAGYTQPGAGQSSYNQANTSSQAGYTQPGAGQSSYNQANTNSQTGYTQPAAGQMNAGSQGGFGRPNNYGASQHDPNRAGRRPNQYGQNANYGQSIHHNPNRVNQDQYTGYGQKDTHEQGDSLGQRNSERRNGAAPENEYKNRFSNDGYGKGRTGYSSSYDSYRFETPVDPAPIEPNEAQYNNKKKKVAHKEKNENKITGKKVGIIAGIAALFGLVAAVVFLGITALFGNKVQEAPSRNNGGSIAVPTPSIILGEPDEDTSVASAGTSDATATVVDLTVPQVVQQCMPSMVAITNTTIEEYRDFFGGRSTQESVSAGSGIIVGETETELLIATNNHVIENSKDITVTFIDESAITGTIKGMDSDNDLAIVAVKLDDISNETKDAIRIITIGNSDDMVVGESVVAIGNALGYGQSVSAGIISALGREVNIDGTPHSLIQTDASINPGNSGGALINMRGELIGINEVKYVDETVEGVGYAIPMSTAEPILSSLGSKAARQKVDDSQASYIGIKCIEVPSYYVAAGYPAGVYVSEVTKGGPAEAAGLKEGDIITAIDGISVTSSAQLINYLQYYAAGETIDFSVSRLNEDNTAFDKSKVPITLGNKNDAGLVEDNGDDEQDASVPDESVQDEEPAEDTEENSEQPEEGSEEQPEGGFPFLPDVENR